MPDTNFVRCTRCKTPNGCMASKRCSNEEAANAPEAPPQQAASPVAQGPAPEAPAEDTARQQEALHQFALSRLCRTCRWGTKPALGNWTYANCTNPELPVNYVTGERVFPCVIARGYEQLCGVLGGKWQAR